MHENLQESLKALSILSKTVVSKAIQDADKETYDTW